MTTELTELPEYRHTMDRLEAAKRSGANGIEYWMSREIHGILGYPVWDKFLPVIEKARQSLTAQSVDPSHHIAQTSKLMGVHGGGKRRGDEFFVSRAACYLIAMNGDPAKPEIAGAQAYFAIRTRQAELLQSHLEDRARVLKREKASDALKRVSDIAKDIGVVRYGLFHDAKYQGLYDMGSRALGAHKGLREGEQYLDRAGHLELSAHAFQADLAAEKILNENINGEEAAITTNREVAQHVRKLVITQTGKRPEDLPLEREPIQEVRKRLKTQARIPGKK